MWTKERTPVWWDKFVLNVVDGNWIDNFRMRRDTFLYICNKLRPHLERSVTNYRVPISVEKRVAIGIWRLATGSEYRLIQHMFGVGLSTACEITNEFSAAIVACLKEKYIRQPTGNDLRDIINGFRDKWGFPQAAGAIDGTHIPIKAPETIRNDYYNRKGWYSVLLQAIVDHRGRIWNVNVGWPGKVHDARVLSNSVIYRSGENGTLFPDWTERFNGVDVPLCLLGDPAYPLLNWLMKPYSEGPTVTQAERQFNYRLSRARMTVECAFGRLKGRWRCLLKRNDTHLTLLPTMITACCVLHNICEVHGERFDEDLIPRQNIQRQLPNNTLQENNNVQAIRDALRDHLFNDN